jgi:hypothetical protein
MVRSASRRLNVASGAASAAKLARLAEQTHVDKGTLTQSLLSQPLDNADPDPSYAATLLDALNGAFERARLGLEDAKEGRTTNLNDL